LKNSRTGFKNFGTGAESEKVTPATSGACWCYCMGSTSDTCEYHKITKIAKFTKFPKIAKID